MTPVNLAYRGIRFRWFVARGRNDKDLFILDWLEPLQEEAMVGVEKREVDRAGEHLTILTRFSMN